MYPTMLGLLGLASQIPDAVDGTNYASLLKTGIGERPTSQMYVNIPAEAQSKGRRGVRTDRHTLIIDRLPNQEEQVLLYDRKTDPYQLENLAPKKPELVKQLIREELVPWLERTGDPWE